MMTDPDLQEQTLARQEILDAFYQRIASNSRMKLTKLEQNALIQFLVEDLKSLDDKEAIRQRCREELALLEAGYPQKTIAHSRLPAYRNAIREAIEAGELLMTEANSYRVEQEDLVTQETFTAIEHYGLTFLKYEDEIYRASVKQTIENNNSKQDNLQPIEVDAFLRKTEALLDSESVYDLICAIAAATGRRLSEIILGNFTPSNQSYTVEFSGQLKKREDTPSYLILTLVEADLLLEAVTRLRSLGKLDQLQNLSIQEVNTRFQTRVNRSVRIHFEETGIMRVLPEETRITIHNLRGAYAEICIYLFCPPTQGTHRFIQAQLGHVIDLATDSQNSPATQHYFHYFLVQNGLPLQTRGIRMIQDSDRNVEINQIAQQTTNISQQTTNINVTQDELAQFYGLLKQAGVQVNEQNQTIHFKTLLAALETLQQQNRTQPPLPGIEYLFKSIDTLTQQNQTLQQRVDELELQTQQHVGINESELQTLLKEREQWVEERALLSEQLQTITLQRDELVTQVAELQTYREKWQALASQFSFAEQAPHPIATASTPETDLENNNFKQEEADQDNADKNSFGARVKGAIEEHNEPLKTRKYLDLERAPVERWPSDALRDSKKPGVADEKVRRAIKAMIEHNENSGEDSEKWAITQSILKELTNVAMAPLQRVYKEWEAVINEHNERHQLGRMHNRGKLQKIADVIQW